MTENLELREWIAVNLMGWRVGAYPDPEDPKRPMAVWRGDEVVHIGLPPNYTLAFHIEHVRGGTSAVPPYELTWNDAALVVEAMFERGWVAIVSNGWAGEGGPWCAEFEGQRTYVGPRVEARAPTAPLAICLAAKAAIEGAQ